MSALIAGAIVGGATIVSSIISANSANQAAETQTEAAGHAADVQSYAAMAGIDETRRQFDAMQEIMAPYVQQGTAALGRLDQYENAGSDALKQQRALMGLDGYEAQQRALAGISGGAEMAALTQQGENAILQQGSATGGLRGGNVQGALSTFRPQVLSDLINQQYGRLGGLVNMGQATTTNRAALGQASAAGVGAAGMQSGAQVAGLLGQQGQALANGIIGAGQATAGGQLATGQAAAAPFNTAAQLAGLYGLNKLGVF